MYPYRTQFAGLLGALSIMSALLGQVGEDSQKTRALEELSSRLITIQSMQADVTQLIIESDGGVLEELSLIHI